MVAAMERWNAVTSESGISTNLYAAACNCRCNICQILLITWHDLFFSTDTVLLLIPFSSPLPYNTHPFPSYFNSLPLLPLAHNFFHPVDTLLVLHLHFTLLLFIFSLPLYLSASLLVIRALWLCRLSVRRRSHTPRSHLAHSAAGM